MKKAIEELPIIPLLIRLKNMSKGIERILSPESSTLLIEICLKTDMSCLSDTAVVSLVCTDRFGAGSRFCIFESYSPEVRQRHAPLLNYKRDKCVMNETLSTNWHDPKGIFCNVSEVSALLTVGPWFEVGRMFCDSLMKGTCTGCIWANCFMCVCYVCYITGKETLTWIHLSGMAMARR